ncbi:MAG TPA: ATP-dependent DNA helicase UvrD2 [Pseudonocardiaceae bacterium]|nr:ATP-dependent DNA helicase UvrD2 [Pseudonocardiaceae bacterium]
MARALHDRDLLDGLDEEQRVVVCAARGPVCVLAGAGTGKTRAITRRIAQLVRTGHVAAGQVLAVTFTARAAGEMRIRLRDLRVGGVQARTFHAAALRQLRYFWPRVVGDQPWPLVEHKLRLVGQAAQRAGAATGPDDLRDLAGEIEWAKASLVTAGDYPAAVAAARRDIPAPAAQIAAVYAGYEEIKNRSRVLDFDDLLLHTAAALEEHSGVAQEFRDRYRCFVVDEYQDVTPLQQRVLDAWLGARDDLTVVGDPNQTIYSFAGAAPRFLLEFTRRFPEAATVRLRRDYRSTPQIVSLANRVICAAASRPAGARLQLEGQQPAGPEPSFDEHDDEPAEAAAVAEAIAELLGQGMAAAEIAVLYRVNAQSEAYEQALDARGIPFQVRGGQRFFQRPEVRGAIRALRAAATAGTVSSAGDLGTTVRELLAAHGLSTHPPGGGAARSRWESLHALVELATDLAAGTPDADLGQLVTELDARADAAHPPAVQGVTLASLHAAKGLEWDAVFLVGLVEGTMPIQYADGDPAALEEERRLLYVGVTRARRWLALSWALSRSAGGRRSRRHSRFLHGLVAQGPPAVRPAGSNAQPKAVFKTASGKVYCRICGIPVTGTIAVKLARCAGCPSDADPELLGRLRDWRTGCANEQRVPPFVIFTDATLTAIAEQRPADAAGLTAIPGIGAAKLDRYGAEVLALVRGSSGSG